jgi:hypothetical protein
VLGMENFALQKMQFKRVSVCHILLGTQSSTSAMEYIFMCAREILTIAFTIWSSYALLKMIPKYIEVFIKGRSGLLSCNASSGALF